MKEMMEQFNSHISTASSSEEEAEYEKEICRINDAFVFEVLTVVPPPLEYLSKLHTKQQEISGRMVWCGSLLLSTFLLTETTSIILPRTNSPRRILELGSGSGIVGMTVAQILSSSSSNTTGIAICLTDGDEMAINLLEQNLVNNQIQSTICDAKLLLWGEDETQEFDNWCIQKWRNIFCKSDVAFDLILAGDVLYKKSLVPLLFSTVRRYLSNNAEFYLCHIPRNHVEHEHVVSAAHEAGFHIVETKTLDQISAAMTMKQLPEGLNMIDAKRAIIYRIRRR